jgi:hypothetical protein
MEHCAMISADRRVSRALLSLLFTGVIGLVIGIMWVFYAHPFTILILAPLRLSAPLRKSLLRILRDSPSGV